MERIVFEDGIISLNGQKLPGILRSLSVDGKVRFDEAKVDGVSGMKKTPIGWEDSDISASLYLCTDEESNCYDKLEMIAGLFRSTDPAANPEIYEISSRHISLRGIRQAVFSKLSTSENDKSDEIIATLGFVEHRPPVVKKEMQVAKAGGGGIAKLVKEAVEKVAGKDAAKPVEDSIIIDVD